MNSASIVFTLCLAQIFWVSLTSGQVSTKLQECYKSYNLLDSAENLIDTTNDIKNLACKQTCILEDLEAIRSDKTINNDILKALFLLDPKYMEVSKAVDQFISSYESCKAEPGKITNCDVVYCTAEKLKNQP